MMQGVKVESHCGAWFSSGCNILVPGVFFLQNEIRSNQKVSGFTKGQRLINEDVVQKKNYNISLKHKVTNICFSKL